MGERHWVVALASPISGMPKPTSDRGRAEYERLLVGRPVRDPLERFRELVRSVLGF